MALRGFAIQTGSMTAPYDVPLPLPAGSIANDLAVAYFGTALYGSTYTFPSDWTILYEDTSPNTTGVKVASKILDSADILAGQVVLSGSGTLSGDYVYGCVTFAGSLTVRETDVTTSSAAWPLVQSTSGSVVSTDGVVLFGGARGETVGPPNNICLSRGVFLGRASSSVNFFGIGLYVEGMVANGVYSAGFSASETDAAGSNAIIVVVENAGLVPAPPSVSCGLAAGQVGIPYSSAFLTANLTCQTVFSLPSGSLPPGLSLDTATGQVTGTPTTAGAYPFTASVAYGAVFDYGPNPLPFSVGPTSCLITISAPAPLSITCGSPPGGSVGLFYAHAFPVSGGYPPYLFAITSGSLPGGLILNSSTGVVRGVPSGPVGTSSFTITVTDSDSETASAGCSITVTQAIPIDIPIMEFRGVKRFTSDCK